MAHTLDISFGPESEFMTSGAVSFIAANPLDDTRFFVAYSETSASAIGKVSVGSVSGSTVSFGSGNVFNNTGSQQIAADILENNKIFVAYSDWGDGSRHGKVKIGTASVSGTDIVFGAEYKFWAAEVNEVAAISLSATKFVVAFRDEATLNHGVAKIGTVSGTTVTFGAAFEFLSENGASDIAVTRLDDDKFVVAYRNEFDLNKGYSSIGSVSGNNITFDTPVIFYNFATNDIAMESFDSNKFVLCHNGLVSPAVIGTVSGTNITFGNSAEMALPNGWNLPSVGILDQDHFVTAFRDRDNNVGSAQIGNVDGTTITTGAKGLFNAPPNGTSATKVFVVDNSKFVVLYRDDADSGHGTAKVGTVPISFSSTDLFLSSLDSLGSSSGTPESPNLDMVMFGSVSGVPTPLIRIINRLTKTHDYDPQLINKFINPPNIVNIQLWDVTDGNNTLATIANSGCYNIGNTNRWAWSTEHLLFLYDRNKYHYYFKMISDLDEETFGEFLIDVPERGLWSYPN